MIDKKYIPIFAGVALILSVGVLVGYKMWAASTFDLLDGRVVVTEYKSVDRIDDKYYADRSIDISKRMYPNGSAPSVVLGDASDPAEALQASIIAGATNGVLLATSNSSAPDRIITEISRLNPSKIYVVGSTLKISSSVDSQIRAKYPTKQFKRISGANKYALAQNVGFELKALNGGVLKNGSIMVTNSSYQYVGIMGYYAGLNKYPILYAGSTIPVETTSFLNTTKPTKTIVVGGTGTIPDVVLSKFPGPTRIAGATRFDVGLNLHRSARNNGFVATNYVGVVSDTDLVGGAFLAPYMTKLRAGLILDEYSSVSSVNSYLGALGSSYGLKRVYVPANDLSISNVSVMKYSNAVGNNYTSNQLSLQKMLDERIKMCPILSNSAVDYGDSLGYQAITYYSSGKIIVNPSHTASLTTILNHEIYHIIDYRDNGRIDWGENIPRSTPDCTP